MTAGWWRRNAAALGAVALLLPATALAVGGHEWWLMNQSRPVVPTTVEAGETAAWAGVQWGPAVVTERRSTADEQLPEGTTVMVVEVPVDPQGSSLSCGAPVLRETDGERRQWDDATAEVEWDYDRPTACDSDARAPYTIAAPFLVPDDADGPFGVEIMVIGELPGFLRLEVVP